LEKKENVWGGGVGSGFSPLGWLLSFGLVATVRLPLEAPASISGGFFHFLSNP